MGRVLVEALAQIEEKTNPIESSIEFYREETF